MNNFTVSSAHGDFNFHDHQNRTSKISNQQKSPQTGNPALLQIGQRLLNRAGRADVANSNVNFALHRSRAIDSFQQQTSDSISRLRELTIRAGDGTLSAKDRRIIDREAQQILEQMDSDFHNVRFNGQTILQGENVEVFVTSDANAITLQNGNANREDLGLTTVDLTTSESAQTALASLTSAEDIVNSLRTELGTNQRILEQQLDSNLSEEGIALEAADSFLVTDIAEALVNETSSSVMNDVRLAIQAQANNLESDVLTLLRF